MTATETRRGRRRLVWSLIAVALAAALAAGALYRRHQRLPAIDVEPIARRDLIAVVSASGRIEPQRSVNISADTIGRVTRLSVEEGDRVMKGQFLLQIDPETLESAVQRGEAGLGAAREAGEAARKAVAAARASLELAEQNVARLRRLHQEDLLPREELDRGETELTIRRSELEARETEVRSHERRLEQEVASLRSARHDLTKVKIEAPMEGVISRLNIEEGETVLVGTMNNPGTVLMTISDLSVIQARLEVDETDIVDLRLGQPAKVSIDAFADRSFQGAVTKIGSSSLGAAQSQTGTGATLFEVEVTLSDEVPGAKPGFSCTADITTATRRNVVAVPIQALTVREMVSDAEGNMVPLSSLGEAAPPPSVAGDVEDVDAVFLLRDGRARLAPVSIGIAGERHFEVIEGLRPSDLVIVGPFAAVRDLEDGDEVRVRVEEETGRTANEPGSR